MEFIKYPNLTNDYAISNTRYIMTFLNEPSTATEKIDGCNVCFVIDRAGNIQIGKRSGFMDFQHGADQKEFGGTVAYKYVFHDFANCFFRKNVAQVSVFGEYYGFGILNSKYALATRGQRDVRLFNAILLMDDGSKIKVSQPEFESKISQRYRVPFLERGTLKDLLSHDPCTVSHLGGDSEGTVIQIDREIVINDRPFVGVKHKNPIFMERRVKKPKPSMPVSTEDIDIFSELTDRVNARRVLNVLSHDSLELSKENYGKIIPAVINDIVEETARETDYDASQLWLHTKKLGGNIVLVLNEMI